MKKAYTLLELLLVLTLFSSVSAIVVPFTIRQISQGNVESEADKVRSAIFLTQQNAYTGRNSSDYGIKFNSDSYEIYEGASYAGALNIDVENLPSSVQFTAVNLGDLGDEVHFSLGSVIPSTDGVLTISDGTSTNTITITSQGSILIQ